MSSNLIRLCLLALAALVIQSCSIKYSAVGSFDNYAAVFEGSIAVGMTGSGTLTLHEVGGDISCSGSTWVTYQPSFLKKGARGAAAIECSDGRIVDVTWVQSEENSGNGRGRDQEGNSLRFRYATNRVILDNYRRQLVAGELSG
ncbi:MAG: hypothetical protein QF894_12075 [Alphaproteobacteria bacterium]|jgi:hypothetical protein|nr:hypothetical protein [Alphaproteobacteria bacterium]|tara:strand:+ start:307 stop:738 length:432 start_codon:yes stop_codon:yes gene_type:complete